MLQFKGGVAVPLPLSFSAEKKKGAIGICVRLSPYLFTRAIQAQSTKQSNRPEQHFPKRKYPISKLPTYLISLM